MFVDLNKAYDTDRRDLTLECLLFKNVLEGYINILPDMYRDSVRSIVTKQGKRWKIPVKVGLHQGSALSLFLSSVSWDVLNRNLEVRVPFDELFAGYLVVIDSDVVRLEQRRKNWREAPERANLNIVRQKVISWNPETPSEIGLEGADFHWLKNWSTSN